MRRISPRLLLLAALVPIACGTVAEGGGGGENLPSRRIVPFDPLAPSPVVLESATADLTEPEAVVVGAEVHLYLAVQADSRSGIHRADSNDGESFAPPAEVLAPEAAWEEDWITSPAVVVVGGETRLYYLAGVARPVVGLARSSDGRSFAREPEPIFEGSEGERLLSFDIVAWNGGYSMFYASAATAAEDDPPPAAIHRADSTDGLGWTPAGAVLSPGTDCRDLEGEPATCWDALFVTAPGARVSVSPLGRPLLDLWYTGGMGRASAVGFSASFDGTSFSRYELNPLIEGDGRARAPSLAEVGSALFLYHADIVDGRSVVCAAVNR